RNVIHALYDHKGVWVDEPSRVADAFIAFYKELLGTNMRNRLRVLPHIVNTGKKVEKGHLDRLRCNFSKEDVKRVLFSIPITKAPGLDGFNSGIFKLCWEVVGDEILDAILDFFSSGKLLTEINVTTLTLIPKV
ncbi:hypothetical protein RDABS01_009820, partial [Bienertia sinuspersici]